MSKLMIVIAIAGAVFLYDPQSALRQIDSGLAMVGWKRPAVSSARLTAHDRAREPTAFEPKRPRP